MVTGWVGVTYPSPGKEGDLEGILKEDKVDEVKNEARAVEPEEVITGLHHRHSLHHFPSLLNSQRHLRYDHLQLRPNQQQNLPKPTKIQSFPINFTSSSFSHIQNAD